MFCISCDDHWCCAKLTETVCSWRPICSCVTDLFLWSSFLSTVLFWWIKPCLSLFWFLLNASELHTGDVEFTLTYSASYPLPTSAYVTWTWDDGSGDTTTALSAYSSTYSHPFSQGRFQVQATVANNVTSKQFSTTVKDWFSVRPVAESTKAPKPRTIIGKWLARNLSAWLEIVRFLIQQVLAYKVLGGISVAFAVTTKNGEVVIPGGDPLEVTSTTPVSVRVTPQSGGTVSLPSGRCSCLILESLERFNEALQQPLWLRTERTCKGLEFALIFVFRF